MKNNTAGYFLDFSIVTGFAILIAAYFLMVQHEDVAKGWNSLEEEIQESSS
ncbi:hypothetical protein [Alteribacillus bidgolensis]|uniref:hypothetical protein n=1 Tax=Alteribacillus bidgolensis TaxID=930129 RepID=UPI001474B5B9|nr:hypothetical protein [Alteribacillus bidgolensis]